MKSLDPAWRFLASYKKLEVNILTKSALVQRDMLILRQLQACEVGFTITTLEPDIARVFEPGASPPHLRLEAAQQLIKAGIPVWVFIAPLLPGLSDTEEAMTSLMQTLHQNGIKEIMLDYIAIVGIIILIIFYIESIYLGLTHKGDAKSKRLIIAGISLMTLVIVPMFFYRYGYSC